MNPQLNLKAQRFYINATTTMIALIEQLTKATLHVVTHPALAQYLLAQHRGFILAPDYQRLTVSSLDYKDISLHHTPLKPLSAS